MIDEDESTIIWSDKFVGGSSHGSVLVRARVSDQDTRLYQIWIKPDRANVKPRWETREFPNEILKEGSLPVLVSGRQEDAEQGPLFIHQNAAIYGGRLEAGTVIEQLVKANAYILVSVGNVTMNGKTLKQGDGAEAAGEKMLHIKAESDAEILVIDIGP